MNPKLKLAAGYTSLALAALIGMAVGCFEGSLTRRALSIKFPALGVVYGIDRAENSGVPTPPEQVYRSVVSKIRHDYVSTNGQVTDKALIAGSLGRMMNSLEDSHSSSVSPALAAATIGALHGRVEGIGAELSVEQAPRPGSDIIDRFLRVVTVMPGGAAEAAGIRSGDRIVEVDGRFVIAYATSADFGPGRDKQSGRNGETPGISAGRVKELLCTGSGAAHTLMLQRPGSSDVRTVYVTTAAKNLPLIEQRRIADGVLLVRIHRICMQSARELDSAVADPARYSKGIILDLRQCAGGLTVGGNSSEREDALLSYAHLMGWFVPGQVAAQIERRPGRQDPLKADPTTAAIHGPIAVLVDAGTSGLAECAAICLKTQAGAHLIGETTGGQDLLPELCTLGDAGGITFPCMRLRALDGTHFESGIHPDVTCTSSDSSCVQEALHLFGREVARK